MMYNDFENSISIYEGANAAVIDDIIDVEPIEVVKESSVMQSYMDGDLTGNTDAKKLVAAALNIANDKGYIKFPKQYANPYSIAIIADKAVETVKLAHDVAMDKIDADEAVNFVIKKGSALLKTVADSLLTKGINIVAKTVTSAITAVYPPAEVVTPVIEVGIKHFGQKVKEVVKKGIDKIAEVAKPMVKKVVDTGKKVVKKVLNWIFG